MPKAVLESKKSLRKKVLRGVSWLDKHAPTGWKYRLFEGKNGEFIFLGQLCMAQTSILPLAFGNSLSIEHLSDVGICTHFNMTHEFRVNHGFFVNIAWDELIQRLNEAWEEVLREKIKEDESLLEK